MRHEPLRTLCFAIMQFSDYLIDKRTTIDPLIMSHFANLLNLEKIRRNSPFLPQGSKKKGFVNRELKQRRRRRQRERQ